MIVLLWITIGFILSTIVWIPINRRLKSNLNGLSDEKVRLEQEKIIVVDFMHNLAVAIGEESPKKISTKELHTLPY